MQPLAVCLLSAVALRDSYLLAWHFVSPHSSKHQRFRKGLTRAFQSFRWIFCIVLGQDEMFLDNHTMKIHEASFFWLNDFKTFTDTLSFSKDL